MRRVLNYSIPWTVLWLLALTTNCEELPTLTLEQAHDLAIRNHPRITVSNLKALAAREVTREAQAAYLPSISANAVAVGTAEENTRLAAIGTLNNPSIFDRNAEGLTISQLITDFGRTVNLTRAARLRAEAEANDALATREQILLAVDAAYFSVLRAQTVTRVAQQTEATRQSFLDQVSALAEKKLRSELDVSFARVNFEDARLLLSKSQNDLKASETQLSTLLGEQEPKIYRLPDLPMPPGLSTNVSGYVQEALRDRPDLLAVRQQQEAAGRFAKAEKALRYPTISAMGAIGFLPIHDPELPDHYAAAGVVLNVPLFTGGLYTARQHQAELEAEAAAASVRDAENNIIRDVRVSWLNAQNAYDRYRITGQLLDNARQSYDLAQARYKNGISSIVELNQAELTRVSAEIAYATTQYEYLGQRSVLDYQTGALH